MDKNFKAEEKEILDLYFEKDLFHEIKTFSYLENYRSGPGVLPVSGTSLLKGIELIVRPQCNQKCEYCYIARYGHELYPQHERLTNEEILKRIDSILDYVFDTKDTYINHWELFAGDLFMDDLGFNILEKFIIKLEHLFVKHRRVMSLPENLGLLLIPNNFSWIDDDEKVEKMEYYIKRFAEVNWDLGLSISTDGAYGVDTREQRELNADHFDKLFKWTLKYPQNGFHPIISASNVHNAIESYEWWRDSFKKHYGDDVTQYPQGCLPYWLEARNDEWTDEAIQDYIKLLDFMLEDRLAMCDNDIDRLAYHLFNGGGENNTLPGVINNDLINLKMETDPKARQITQCSLTHCFCINLSNMSFVPCHRLSYPQFMGGKFLLDENNIVTDYEAKNVSGYLATVCHSVIHRPKCTSCIYNLLCHHGCLGAQFEATGELFEPAISVCQFNYATMSHLIRKYWDMGLIASARKQNILPAKLDVIYSEILVQQIGLPAEEVYRNE